MNIFAITEALFDQVNILYSERITAISVLVKRNGKMLFIYCSLVAFRISLILVNIDNKLLYNRLSFSLFI